MAVALLHVITNSVHRWHRNMASAMDAWALGVCYDISRQKKKIGAYPLICHPRAVP